MLFFFLTLTLQLSPLVLAEEGDSTLTRLELIQLLETANPSLEALHEGAIAAQREAQTIPGWSDLQLELAAAPGGLRHASSLARASSASLSLPLPSWRQDAQRRAQLESLADSERSEVEHARLQHCWMGSRHFDAWYLVHRALSLNAEFQKLVRRLSESASAHYASGHGDARDPLAARLELALLQEEAQGLEIQRRQHEAAIRRELGARPDRIPRPPPRLEAAPPPEGLQAGVRWELHPALQASEARLDALEHELLLTQLEARPEGRLISRYSGMWEESHHRWMLGLGLSLPLDAPQRRAREQAVSARTRQQEQLQRALRWELEEELAAALAAWEQASQRISLYEEEILPTARRQVAAAESDYLSGQAEFSDWIATQRQLQGLELAAEQARVDSWRWAEESWLQAGQMPPHWKQQEER